MEVVILINNVPTDAHDRPLEPVVVEKVVVSE
jgi:hypothetical protein